MEYLFCLEFAVDYTPGGDTSTLNGFLILTLVGDQAHFEAKVRRIHFEAYSSTMAEFQRRQLRTEDDDKIRQVPPEERKQRLDNFLAKYRGLKVDFQTEPSDHLIDRFVDIQERGVLRHVPWHEYTSKSFEVEESTKGWRKKWRAECATRRGGAGPHPQRKTVVF